MQGLCPGKKLIDILETEDIGELRPVHITDLLDPQGQQENEDDREDGVTDDPAYESIEYTGNLNPEAPPHLENVRYKKIVLPSDDNVDEFTRSLVPEQMKPLRKVIASCKAIVRNYEKPHNKAKPVHLILHGGPGTGKSKTIKAIALNAERILRKAGDVPDHPAVLLCAFTGKAANLIGGITLHRAFSFMFGNKRCYLSDKKLAESQKYLDHLKLLIIDEISFVGADMLYKIHFRLKEIFDTPDHVPFAGLNVLLVGDLLQLPPVKARPIFSKPMSDQNVSLWNSDQNLWESFDVMTLTSNLC